MAREFAAQSDVLEAIQSRLVDQIDELTDSNCFVTDHPYHATIPHGDVIGTVCPGPGTFDQGMFAGAGFEQIKEETVVIVTVFIRQMADREGEATQLFNNANRGLFRIFKPAILKSLLIDDSSGTRVAWEPVKNGAGLLRDQIAPLSTAFEPLQTSDGVDWAGMSVRFSTSFDWEL